MLLFLNSNSVRSTVLSKLHACTASQQFWTVIALTSGGRTLRPPVNCGKIIDEKSVASLKREYSLLKLLQVCIN